MTVNPGFRDSGVEWIGAVPSHWRTVPTRSALAILKEEVGPAWSSTPLLSLTKQGVILRDIDSGEGKFPESFETYQIVHPDDLVFCLFDMDETPRTVGLAQARGMITSAYTRFVVNREVAVPRFLEWYYVAIDDGKRFRPLYSGLRKVIQKPRFLAAGLVLPPVEEQQAIADYLDRETARIDMLIEEQQRLIAMLRERREATVRSVLLSGLDGAAVAPSGVDALGPIPGHWRMVPTRYLCTITTGSEDSGNATDDGKYPFYVRGREVLRIDHYSFDGEAVMTPGDGQGGTGKVFHYFEGKFEAHQRVYVFKDFAGLLGRYFYYFLSTFLRPVALAGSNTVTMESLRRPLLADFKIAVPPLDEQARITVHLDEQVAKIDALMEETERFIEFARERRSALITAAVTGQIDVREA